MKNFRRKVKTLLIQEMLAEAAGLNFYDFKKTLKKSSAKLGIFVDNVVITGDATVTIDFHASDSASHIKTLQYYKILNRIYREDGYEYESYNLIKNKGKSNGLQLIDNNTDDDLFKKPNFQYTSSPELKSLDLILEDFYNKIKQLGFSFNMSRVEQFMKELFIKEQKRLLARVTVETYESIDTTLTLAHENYYVDVKYKLKLDPVKLMIVGQIEMEFMQNGKPSTFNFTTLQELQNIIGTAFDLIKVEKFF